MKKLILAILSLLLMCSTYAQTSAETEIRELEMALKEAFLKKDTAVLFELYSPDFVVNTPNGNIINLPALKTLIQNGFVDRDVFEKVIEKVTFNNNIAIVMGSEVLRPSGNMPNAGKTVKRRYTNVWMKKKKTWQLVARQSTIISVE
jgi:ketosteroid isomerase-like protein